MEFWISFGPSDACVDIEVSKESIKKIRKLASSEEYEDTLIDNLVLEDELPDVYEEIHSAIVVALQEQIDEFGHDLVAEEIDFGFDLPEEIFE